MPIYEFRCQGCGTVFERLIRMKGDRLRCPACGALEPQRLISLIAATCGCGSACESGAFT